MTVSEWVVMSVLVMLAFAGYLELKAIVYQLGRIKLLLKDIRKQGWIN